MFPGLGEAERRQLENEVAALPRQDSGRQPAHGEDHRQHHARPDGEAQRGAAAQHRHDHRELRGARDAEGQEEDDDEALLGRLEDAGRQGRHRVAPETQHHGEHGLAVQPHPLEDLVHHHREPGEIPRVLEQAEGEEEGSDDGKHQGQGVGERHGDQAVRTHEQIAERRPRDPSLGQGHRPGVQEAAEEPLLENLHEGARAEDSHEQIAGSEDPEKYRDARDRVSRGALQSSGEASEAGPRRTRHRGSGKAGCLSDAGLAHDVRDRLRPFPLRLSADLLERRDIPGRKARPEPGRQRVVPGEDHDGERTPRYRRFGKAGGHLRDRCLQGLGIGDAKRTPPGLGERAPQASKPLVSNGDCRHDLDAQSPRKAIGVDRQAGRGGFVHHVEAQDERDLHFGELQRQHERPLQVLGVTDHDHGVVASRGGGCRGSHARLPTTE